jgi:hypothetical protein
VQKRIRCQAKHVDINGVVEEKKWRNGSKNQWSSGVMDYWFKNQRFKGLFFPILQYSTTPILFLQYSNTPFHIGIFFCQSPGTRKVG